MQTDYTTQNRAAKQGEQKQLFAWDLESFKAKASLKEMSLYTPRPNFTACC